jgi:four helix bundle protein
MEQFFPHERLDVYAKALSFAEMVLPAIAAWPATVAVRDQLDRAIESLVTNLVKAARLQRTNQATYYLECSLGSVLECAACLDVAQHRNLIDAPQLLAAKEILQQVARMEVGLRSSWCRSLVVREDAPPYVTGTRHFFAHESLIVYQRSLQIHELLGSAFPQPQRERRYAKRIDELTTSLTVNIAEGNGRFSKLDHGKFVEIAEDAGSKLSAYLDLAATAWAEDMSLAKCHLREVMAMLEGLKGYLDGAAPGGEEETKKVDEGKRQSRGAAALRLSTSSKARRRMMKSKADEK